MENEPTEQPNKYMWNHTILYCTYFWVSIQSSYSCQGWYLHIKLTEKFIILRISYEYVSDGGCKWSQLTWDSRFPSPGWVSIDQLIEHLIRQKDQGIRDSSLPFSVCLLVMQDQSCTWTMIHHTTLEIFKLQGGF